MEVENNFLLESLAACHDTDSKVVMYLQWIKLLSITLTVLQLNCFFKGPDLNKQDNLQTNFTYFLPPPEVDSKLLTAPKFDLKERHTNTELEAPDKNFFFNTYILDVFPFVTQ